MRIVVVSQILEKISFFQNLTKQQHIDLAHFMEAQYFNTNDVVFEEGEPGNKLYVIIEGGVTMYKRSLKQVPVPVLPGAGRLSQFTVGGHDGTSRSVGLR